MRHGELLQDELVDGVLELGEGVATANVVAGVAEALVESSKKVEGQRVIRDGFPKICKLLRHVLEAPAKVRDRQITLDKTAELDVEVEGAGLPIAEKLVLQGAPDGTGGGDAIDHHISARLVEIVPAIQDLTTQSMRVQSGKSGAGRSTRT